MHLRTRSTITEPAIDASGPPEEVPVPDSQEGIDELRLEIDDIDAKLVRADPAPDGDLARDRPGPQEPGRTQIVYSREMAVLERFRALGPAGTDLGMMLLAMGRGKLGRK